MSKTRFALVVPLALLLSTSAFAQATRTWVSGVGDDVNPCSRTAPCKTFAGAISKTASGGLINVLDPGGFGAVTITKGITIDGNPGAIAGVLASGTQGIVVNALTTDNVMLRNLDIEGAGTTLGTNGINVIQAAALIVDKCRVTQFSSHAIVIGVANTIRVQIVDTNVYANTGDGIDFLPSSGAPTVNATINRCQISNNNVGVYAQNGALVSVSNSTISGNATGIKSEANTGTTLVNVRSCIVSHNNTGLTTTTANAFIRLSQSNVENNATNGFNIVAGQIFSYGDNYIANTTNVGSLSTATKS